jgi:spermidine synthase
MERRWRLDWVVFAGGAVLMALEILSSRILAPRFGNSVYVWGSIISVFLGALAVGYWWGGRLADRRPSLARLGRLVAWAALSQAVLAAAGPAVADLLGRSTGSASWGPLLAATVLFAPPSVLLATLSPYAVRLAARDLARLGHTAGNLYAISTAGSLVGTLGATFLLIPFLPLARGLSWLLALTAATALLALAGRWREERLATALALLLLALALVGPPSLPIRAAGVVYEETTPYQTLRIVDRGEVRYLESDGVVHGAVRRDDGELALVYPRLLPVAWLLSPDIERVLILGMGGGNVAGYLGRAFPGVAIEFVEIDPAVPEVARRYMGFASDEHPGVHVGDARRWLESSGGRWDLIVADTYIGLSVPFHLTTREFLADVERHLNPGGVFAVNLASRLDAPFAAAIVHTLAAQFPTLVAFATPGRANRLVFATAGPAPGEAALRERARRLGPRRGLDPGLAELIALRIDPLVEMAGAPRRVLTDDFAPVDRLIRLSGELPREPGRPDDP